MDAFNKRFKTMQAFGNLEGGENMGKMMKFIQDLIKVI